MKKITPALLLFYCFANCTKDNSKWITGTVVMAVTGCQSNSWIVNIDNPSHTKYSFLCSPEVWSISSSTTHCGNAAIILDVPSHLAQPGKKIKFSNWQDKGLMCFSSTMFPHHLAVYDLSER